MEGEAIYYAPTLSLPEQDERTIQKILEYESIQLFTERAALVLSSFHLTTDNMEATTNICRRLDGIPLAIEMAAARVDTLSVDEILKQLNHSFELLVGKSRNALPRHQTMRASMDWSWGLLTEPERKFMCQLSIFAGGWTLDSAQAVCERDVLDLTSALVKKSLIRVKQEAGHETRFQFHEIVRQYAYEKLVGSGEEKSLRTRHLKYFLGLSKVAEPELKGPTQIEWMARLRDERDNIRAALGWADKTDLEAGLYISSRFERFWESFDIREGNYWLSTFLQKPASQDYPRIRAMALYAHLPILNYLNEVDTWRSTVKECLELCHAFGYQSIEMDILLMTAGEIPSVEERTELFQQALNLAQASADIWRQARTLHQVGWNYGGKERLVYWERAITLFRLAEDWRELAQCLSTTVLFALLNGDLELAQKCLDEVTLLNDQLQDKETKASLLHAYTRISMIRGDYNQARIYSQEELGIAEELGARMSSLWCRSQMGYLALCEGNLTEARDIFTKTVQEFFTDKNTIGVVFTLEQTADLYIAIEKPEQAARLIGWADATRKQINDTRPRLEQTAVDKIIAACIKKMGEFVFSDAYDKGQKMYLEEAVAYALNES